MGGDPALVPAEEHSGPGEQPSSEALVAPLKAVLDLLDRTGVEGIVIGGVAASLLAKPRFTADVDAVVLLAEELDQALERFVQAANEVGLTPRIPDALPFARSRRVLLLHHEVSGIHVDISLGVLPFEVEAISRARRIKVGQVTIPLPTPEDLIIMKAVAHRPQDLADIRALATAHPDLDLGRIKRYVGEFAAVLEMPELWDDIAPLLQVNRDRGATL